MDDLERTMKNYGPVVAATLIIAFVAIGFALMPRIMEAISGGGPVLGAAVAILFILAFFGIFWLRGRYQERRRTDRD